MSERPIRLFGDPVLTAACAPVDLGSDGVPGLVEDLLDTVRLPGRAGVAANQIGVGVRAFSYNVDGAVGYLLNPELVSVEGDPVEMDEGCLSVPELWFPVLRHPAATARGVDLEGNVVEVSGTGVLAQALQHETDHLEGRLYIHRLTPERRREAMRRIRTSGWF